MGWAAAPLTVGFMECSRHAEGTNQGFGVGERGPLAAETAARSPTVPKRQPSASDRPLTAHLSLASLKIGLIRVNMARDNGNIPYYGCINYGNGNA